MKWDFDADDGFEWKCNFFEKIYAERGTRISRPDGFAGCKQLRERKLYNERHFPIEITFIYEILLIRISGYAFKSNELQCVSFMILFRF